VADAACQVTANESADEFGDRTLAHTLGDDGVELPSEGHHHRAAIPGGDADLIKQRPSSG
jgi:hypothetical protein